MHYKVVSIIDDKFYSALTYGQIQDFHVNYKIGPFETEIEAAQAYDREQRKMYGPKAIFVNFRD